MNIRLDSIPVTQLWIGFCFSPSNGQKPKISNKRSEPSPWTCVRHSNTIRYPALPAKLAACGRQDHLLTGLSDVDHLSSEHVAINWILSSLLSSPLSVHARVPPRKCLRPVLFLKNINNLSNYLANSLFLVADNSTLRRTVHHLCLACSSCVCKLIWKWLDSVLINQTSPLIL